ncbi:hypothetical protein SARC_06581 [Sphaeroforma arctica JP610]|uniref:Calmodulin n=1 Tax=Sphaeroforma arctica JP610 TaxID=667725 RepID=A0A0L0FYR0_9EUKA|nr:hypothetical protein SARC_06581 [Sphaeroforma arctica JP610]KNC81078.1 hypothetical protein SARC_06581 [Sphaeroforma arctica JP610]|eukprot:XP_014154980.1 hypothetical protein SARC_06581 [Sphaeroforma arctica JP610]
MPRFTNMFKGLPSLNSLLVLGTGASGIFLAGGYYFSMQEKYERLIEKIQLQLERERMTRELHDDRMMDRLNHERDQQSLALTHLRRSYEGAIHAMRVENQKLLFDIAFHGDYEKFRTDVEKGINMGAADAEADYSDPSTHRGLQGLIAQTVAHITKTELGKMQAQLDGRSLESPPIDQGGDFPMYDHGQASNRDVMIHVKNFLGTRLCEIFVHAGVPVRDLKYRIEDATLIPPERQNLYFKGKKLQEGPSLEDYNVSDGSVIHLRPRSEKEFVLSDKTKPITRTPMPASVRKYVEETPDVVAKSKQGFRSMDLNGDGVLSKEELKGFLYRNVPSISAVDIDIVTTQMDVDQSGYIAQREWSKFWADVAEGLNNRKNLITPPAETLPAQSD